MKIHYCFLVLLFLGLLSNSGSEDSHKVNSTLKCKTQMSCVSENPNGKCSDVQKVELCVLRLSRIHQQQT
ncbi:rCG28045 [Rattus norvegicus]|uniref:RCG28045 n=1 Tax=Rattus norvegicus TaxID=10116 RepID=A6IDZ8_RAT|nr:rCG28045 [Rattus norvegicus]